MKQILSILLFVSTFLIVGCQPKFKDSYDRNGKGRKVNLKFKDAYGGGAGRKSQIGFRDSYSGSSGRKIKFGFIDSYGGSTGRKNQHEFRDTYGSRSNGRKGQFGFKDSFGSSKSKKIDTKQKKDSYGTSSRNGRRGYKDPEKKWWQIRGKQRRQGKPFRNRKGYDSPDAKHTIPKKKKKIKRSTKFEGMK